MQRRQFLANSVLAAGGAISTGNLFLRQNSEFTSYRQGPVWSFDPVVGDGKCQHPAPTSVMARTDLVVRMLLTALSN